MKTEIPCPTEYMFTMMTIILKNIGNLTTPITMYKSQLITKYMEEPLLYIMKMIVMIYRIIVDGWRKQDCKNKIKNQTNFTDVTLKKEDRLTKSSKFFLKIK